VIASLVLSAFFSAASPVPVAAAPAAIVMAVTAANKAQQKAFVVRVLCKLTGNKFAFCKG